MDSLWQDLRCGLRLLRKTPGFAAVAVFTLALGIGANTAIFSLINALILRPLPVEKPEQLVQFLSQGYGMTGSHFSYPDFEQFRDRNQAFSGVVAVFWLNEPLLDARFDGQPESISGQLVSGDFFSLLGVHAAAGRLFTREDDKVPGGNPVAVLSYAYWKRRFAQDPSILGKSIILRGTPFTVIGVAPPVFGGVTPGFSPDVYVPFATEPVFHDGITWLDKSSYHWLQILARLRAGVSRQQALAELSILQRQMLAAAVKPDWPQKDREAFLSQKLELTTAASGFSDLRRFLSIPVFVLAGMVGLVLLIACANVASMLLARAVTRRREFAVRLALGAGHARVIRQLLTESVLLGLGGGAAGLLLAFWLGDILAALLSLVQGSIRIDLRPDYRVLGFTTAMSFVTTLLFGLLPALRATQLELSPALKEDPRSLSSSKRRLRTGRTLVVSQVALSIVLAFVSVLFVRTLQKLETLDPGFNRENVLLFSVDPTPGGYKGAHVADLYRRVLERLSATPGVRTASLSAITPIWGGGWNTEVWVQGYTARPNEDVVVNLNSVGPKFFETLQIPLVLGRDFGPQDSGTSRKVAIINRAMAHYFFGDQNPIGKKFGWMDKGETTEFEIVGVVGDAKYMNMREQPPRTAYIDFFQDSLGKVSFEVRTAAKPAALVSGIRSAVEEVSRGAQVSGFKTLAEQVDESLGTERLIAVLSSLFGVLALVLAAVGLYGIMSHAVAQRTSEIGIRMALGAERADVLWMIMRQTLALILTGACIGLPAAIASARLVLSLLFDLKPGDPGAIMTVILVLGITTLAAGYLPARQASKVDPMVALRCE
jgi:predicted permease